jgi:hypothetical protein
MRLDEAMKSLERAGTPAMRKTYARHGAQEPMFGTPYAALYALQKQIGTDHDLALALWDTGNHDARVLATLVADGQRATPATLKKWLRAANHRFLAMAFAAVAARCKEGLACALQWIDAPEEFVQAAGWGTLAGLVNDRAIPDATFVPLLGRLQTVMHGLPNYARYAANNCLIAIGSRPELTAEAMRVAKAVGRVDVDHGDTSCETPVAADYIAKVAARAAGKGKGNAKVAVKAKLTKRVAKITVKNGAKKRAR